MEILIEIGVALLWIGLLLFIFNPKFVPKEKRADYRSRKLRFSIVVFGVITSFYTMGKIEDFNAYKEFVIFMLLIISGANVADKYVTTSQKKKEEEPTSYD